MYLYLKKEDDHGRPVMSGVVSCYLVCLDRQCLLQSLKFGYFAKWIRYCVVVDFIFVVVDLDLVFGIVVLVFEKSAIISCLHGPAVSAAVV